MKKVRKKLFTLSGLFMVLAQVFVMAFSGIVAVAVTQDETIKNLFDVNGSSATMAYELVDNDTIKWTVNLKKGANDSPTRFMVDLKAGDSSVVPEQIQSTNPEMVFESNYGDEYIQGGFSEQAAGSMSGDTTISFVTTRQISNLVVTPKLVTVPVANEAVAMTATLTTDSTTEVEAEVQPTVASEPVNLLENVPTVTFDIPAVEAEETEENQEGNQEENTPVTPEVEGDVEDETTTPGTEVETEDGTEVAADTTENEEVKNQDVVAEEPDSGSETSTLFQGFSTFARIQATAEVKDPFEYYGTTNSDGIYPKHETNEFSQSGEDIDDTTDNIRNYNYGSDQKDSDKVSLFDISGKGLDFRNGYHEYGNSTTGQINTKKTVMPTSDENIFQIQLDTIGDAIRPFPEVDIVLVLDRSGSMTTKTGDKNSDTRWKQLQQAVDKFSKDILSENKNGESRIQIGLVGFYSHGHTEKVGKDNVHVIDYMGADTSRFTTTLNGNNVTSGFSSSSEAIVKHPIVTSELETSGTPTFIGVDAGIDLLKNGEGARPKAKKVMITITDGLPTFTPGTDYSFTANSTEKIETTNYFQYTTTQYSGDGSASSGSDEEESYNTATINHINAAYSANTGIQYCGVGFHMDANSVLKALGPNGQTYVASEVDELTNALKQSVVRAIYTIGNATLIDPMSEYVEFVNYDETTEVKTEGLYLKDGVLIPGDYDFATGIDTDFDKETNQVIATGVSLGQEEENGRQGYRITYKVELKEKYRDGNFYPTNGTTYLANGERGNHYYAVPSIRTAPTLVTVSFKKINAGAEVLAGAQFGLFKGDEKVYESNITVVNGTADTDGIVKFEKVIPGEYTLKEIKIPDGHTPMDDIEVVVTRDETITLKNGDPLETVENTRKQIDVSLTKLGADGEALSGVTFELQQGDTKLEFSEHSETPGLYELKNVSPGTYDLVENTAPEGYEVLGTIGTVEIDKYGKVTFTKEAEITQNITADSVEGTDGRIHISFSSITNRLKPIDINLNKIGPDGEAFKGATFELQQQGLTVKKFTESTTTAGLHELKDVVPGTYDLVETGAPEGYEVLGKIGELIIDKHGKASFKAIGEEEFSEMERNVGEERIEIALPTVTNELKPFDLTVLKTDDAGVSLVGATFELTGGPDHIKQTIESNDDNQLSSFVFEGLKPGTYALKETATPEGHVGISGPIEIVISDKGVVTIDSTKVTPELKPGIEHNTISYTVTNKKKVPLPATGGSGTMLFVTIGVLGLLSTGLYFLQRKDQEVA